MKAAPKVLITGGAGFIGTNMADRLLRMGQRVAILDDISRDGVIDNLRWLQDTYGDRVELFAGDIRDAHLVARAVKDTSRVFHFAAQVAVTTSVTEPMRDFSVNLLGTMTLLEALRNLRKPPALLFTSTNKVYGGLDDITIVKRGDRYAPGDGKWRTHGIGEDRPLDFCSPYGCSKGGADQYVLDYAKTFNVPAVVFRMSCIYGPHQCGNEDQGWVAHFLMQAMAGEPITLYGDGCQVRDVLYVDDLIDAMLRATDRVDTLAGRVFNMGGGPSNTVSLRELLAMIGELCGAPPEVDFGDWRIGDQRWYVSDIRSFSRTAGWKPRVGVQAGVRRLYSWLQEAQVPSAIAVSR